MSIIIKLGGYGCNLYLHKLSQDQYDKLLQLGDLNQDNKYHSILEIIEKDHADQADQIFFGAYDIPGDFILSVSDDDDNIVFNNDEDFELESIDDSDHTMFNTDKSFLIIEERLKGNFFNFYFNEEIDFDITKLSALKFEINESITLITGLKYQDEIITKEEDDCFSSKSLAFYLG